MDDGDAEYHQSYNHGTKQALLTPHLMHKGLKEMASKVRSALVAAGFLAILAGQSRAATVVVDPSNPNGWATMVTDSSGAQGSPNPTAGAAFVNGPATPPGGVGSLNLYTGDGTVGGDGSAQVRNSNYAGLLVSAITSLSYSTYVSSNNGQQAPYLTIWVHTDGGDDRLWFEPPYANQGNVDLNQWQTWDALNATAGWYDDNGTNGAGPGSNSVSLATLLADMAGAGYSNATIYNPSATLGGIRIATGFASPEDVFNTNLDNFTIGTSDGATTYDFEPGGAVPEPSSVVLSGMGLVAGLGAWLRRRRVTA